MTKQEFLRTMRSERARWQALLALAGERQALAPGAAGDWSLKDVIVHVTAYERGLVKWLEAASCGELCQFPDLDHPDLAYRNALIWERGRRQSLSEVRPEAGRVFGRLYELVETLDEGAFTDPVVTEWFVRPRWGERRALWECIADDSYRHYRQHIPGIRAWLTGVETDEANGLSS